MRRHHDPREDPRRVQAERKSMFKDKDHFFISTGDYKQFVVGSSTKIG